MNFILSIITDVDTYRAALLVLLVCGATLFVRRSRAVVIGFCLLFLVAAVPVGIGLPVALNTALLQKMPAGGIFPILRLSYAALGDAPPTWFTPSGSACALSATVTSASISTTTLTVTVSGGSVPVLGLVAGGNVLANTHVLAQLTGSAGGSGTYKVDQSQTASGITSVAGDAGSQVPGTAGCFLADFLDRGRVDIRIFGAKADDSTDFMPFALAALRADVGVYLPGSIGIWKAASNVTYADHRLLFTGDYPNRIEDTGACPTGTPQGTWIHISDSTVSPFRLAQGSGGTAAAIYGSDIGNFAVCQDQPAPGGGWAPTVYPAVFNAVSALDCRIHDVYLYGVYDGSNINGNSARCAHWNIAGQAFHAGMVFDDLLDLTQIHDIHLFPFWSTNSNVLAWSKANGDAIDLKGVDDFQLNNVFAFGYRSCLHISNSGSHITTGVQGSITCDGSKYGVWSTVDNTYANQLTIFHTGAGIAGSEGFRNEGANSLFQINGITCFSEGQSCIHDAGATGNNTIQVGPATALGFDEDAGGIAAYRISSGQASPTYMNFGPEPLAILSGPGSGLPTDYGGTGVISVGGWYTKPFTPQLSFGGGTTGLTGTFTGTYSANIYTNQVVGSATAALTAKGSSTGLAVLRGPQIASTAPGAGSFGAYTNMTSFPADRTVNIPIQGAPPSIQLLTGNGSDSGLITEGNFTDTSSVVITFSYQ